MKIFTALFDVLDFVRGKNVGVSIGNFDGVHLAHKQLLSNLVSTSKNNGLISILITFSPHPHLFFHPEERFLIQNKESKYSAIAAQGVDVIWEVEFTAELQKITAEVFFENYLKPLGTIESFHLGHDFRLGKNKERALQKLRDTFVTSQINCLPTITEMGDVVSSSCIRNKLKQGNLCVVNHLLGQKYTIISKVIKGRGIGGKELYPTANFELESHLLYPKKGVYLTRLLRNNKCYWSVTNIGVNPTVTNKEELSIETYIINFSENIYDEKLKIEFFERIRDEKRFNSILELKDQIDFDLKVAKRLIDEY